MAGLTPEAVARWLRTAAGRRTPGCCIDVRVEPFFHDDVFRLGDSLVQLSMSELVGRRVAQLPADTGVVMRTAPASEP